MAFLRVPICKPLIILFKNSVMKKFFFPLAVFLTTSSVSAQVNPAIPAGTPKKQNLPSPKVVALKPDLTIEIENVVEAVYDPANKTTTVKLDIAVYNDSDAGTTVTHSIAASLFRPSAANVDHVFWHIGDFQPGTLLPARATVKRRMVFKIRDIMPPLTTPYRFMLEADKKYVIDEGDETNNQSNEVEVRVTRKGNR
jgi:hypothetical protein